MAQFTYIGCDDCGFENERIYENFDDTREAWIEICGQNDPGDSQSPTKNL